MLFVVMPGAKRGHSHSHKASLHLTPFLPRTKAPRARQAEISEGFHASQELLSPASSLRSPVVLAEGQGTQISWVTHCKS